MEINELERRIIDALLLGPDKMLSDLREQCEHASVNSRDYTGVGFFTHLQLPANTRRVAPANFVIGDLFLDVPETEHGADAMLFIREGLVDFLEVVALNGDWPDNPTIRSIDYWHPQYPIWSWKRWIRPRGRDYDYLRRSWVGGIKKPTPHNQGVQGTPAGAGAPDA